MSQSKPAYKSKTVWFGGIKIILGAADLLFPSLHCEVMGIPAGPLLVVFGAISIGLRFVTSGKVKLKRG